MEGKERINFFSASFNLNILHLSFVKWILTEKTSALSCTHIAQSSKLHAHLHLVYKFFPEVTTIWMSLKKPFEISPCSVFLICESHTVCPFTHRNVNVEQHQQGQHEKTILVIICIFRFSFLIAGTTAGCSRKHSRAKQNFLALIKFPFVLPQWILCLAESFLSLLKVPLQCQAPWGQSCLENTAHALGLNILVPNTQGSYSSCWPTWEQHRHS